MRLGLSVASVAIVAAVSPPVRALEVQTSVSGQRVGVGESIVVQLAVMSDDDPVPEADREAFAHWLETGEGAPWLDGT